MLPGRYQPSTFGTEGLNFCVRDGNRCDPFVIATGNCECFQGLILLSSLTASRHFPLHVTVRLFERHAP